MRISTLPHGQGLVCPGAQLSGNDFCTTTSSWITPLASSRGLHVRAMPRSAACFYKSQRAELIPPRRARRRAAAARARVRS
eukprot:COSAG03_NODE_711_length_6158_cov_95.789734_4_plen_81_part_00